MIKTSKFLMILTVMFFILQSCSDDEKKEFEGTNYLLMTTDKTAINEMDTDGIKITLELTKAISSNLKIRVSIKQDDGVLSLDKNEVSIEAGKRTAELKLTSNRKEKLYKPETYDLEAEIESSEVKQKEKAIKITVNPSPKIPVLTDKQLKLIEGYKTKYGVDISKFLGMVECKTRIHNNPNESYSKLSSPFIREYRGKTLITLSSSSTEDTPVLEMKQNALGLTEYMFWLLKTLTIENEEYWFAEGAGPDYKIITELLDWNKDKPGSFEISIPNMRLEEFNNQTAKVKFTGERFVNFIFDYSVWEKQQKLAKEGNVEADRLLEADGTSNPNYYLMYSSVVRDEYDDSEWFITPSSKIDFKENKMTFNFSIDYQQASGYSKVTVEYEGK